MYCVLLIITDGSPHDLAETQRRLEMYASVPLSVIFVGVGNADFGKLHGLCRHGYYRGSGHAGRNITTVCEFRHHQHDPSSLGQAVMHYMPHQLVEYMQQHDKVPPTLS